MPSFPSPAPFRGLDEVVREVVKKLIEQVRANKQRSKPANDG